MFDFSSCGSKEEWQEVANAICTGNLPLQDLLGALHSTSPQQRQQQVAGYVLLQLARTCPASLDEHLQTLLELLDLPASAQHSSLPRQVFSVLQDRDLDEDLAGHVFAKAVDYFLDQQQAIAVRARALDVCANVATQYLGLWEEVTQLAQSIRPEEGAGMQSIRRRVLAQAAKAAT